MSISRKVDIADIFLGTKRGGFGRDIGRHKNGVCTGIVMALPIQSQNGVPDESRFPDAFAFNKQLLRSAADLKIGNEVNLGIVFVRLLFKVSLEEWNFAEKGTEHLLSFVL